MTRVTANKPQPLDPSAQRELQRVQTEFGEGLRALRHERLLTLEQLAERAGLHPNYVGSVERGERNVSLFNIWRMASGLDVSAAQLLASLPKRSPRRSRPAN